MNGNGESRKEDIGRTKEVLNAKTKTRIGFWNVRTMFETGKLAQVTSEMNRYNLHILGVNESRWTGTGRYKTNTGHRSKKYKEWISHEAWKKIEERRDIKKKILATKSERLKHQQQQAYREIDRDVKKMIRRDKQKRLEDTATLAEDAAYKGDHGTLYKITKQVCGRFRNSTEAPIRNKEGQLLTSEFEKEAR
ncbi:craniofacial development protein 2 [Elysia marginata]|uniref:Craniofacial development protein 2 n=1 Tax=Elysia marginata TaxID=1093978 RepID=A0AAV4JBB4_9GAST|nr:craniofacial development protein 2 [Elysia marginata]